MRNFILVIGNNSYEVNSLEELVNIILGKDYYTLTSDEQNLLLKKKVDINDTLFKTNCNYIIDNDIKYILYLCKINAIMLVEYIDSNVFTKKLDKSNITDNYIIINTFAEKLLKE